MNLQNEKENGRAIFPFALCLYISLMLSSPDVTAQVSIKGVVKDANTNFPISGAFVSVQDGAFSADLTDQEGRFLLVSDSTSSVEVWHPAYPKSTIVTVKSTDSVLIVLNGKEPLLPAVGEPDSSGLLLLRSLMANNRQFDAEELAPFKHREYSRSVAWVMGQEMQPAKNVSISPDDSLGYLYFQEVSAKKTYLDKTQEQREILSSNSIGLQDKAVVSFLNSFDQTALFEPTLTLAHRRFQNPFHAQNERYYHFMFIAERKLLTDTLQVVAFQGKQGVNALTFSGFFYMSRRMKVPVHIEMHYQEKKGIEFSVYKDFRRIKDDVFYPMSSSYTMRVPRFPRRNLHTYFVKNTYASEMELYDDLRFQDNDIGFVIFDNYQQEDERFWNLERKQQAGNQRELTYVKRNMYPGRRRVYRYYKLGKAFYRGELAVKTFGLDLTNVFRLNRYEIARLGLGLRTTPKASKFMEAGIYTAYGFRDARWKFGGDLSFSLSDDEWEKLSFSYLDDLEEPGFTDFFKTSPNIFRRFLTRRMDIIQRARATATFRALQYGYVEVSAEQQRRKTDTYGYQFTPFGQETAQPTNEINQVSLGLRVRYAFREKVARTLEETYLLGTPFPIVYINYTQGIPDVFGSDYQYQKLAIQTDFKRYINRLGFFRMIVEAGITQDDLPYSLLFNGRGGNSSLGGSSGFFIRDAFQTMGLYDYVSNRYVNIFTSHDFGSLLFSEGNFKPEIGIAFNMGWGVFTGDESRHDGILFQDYAKGFYETGLLFNNLLKARFFGVVKGGLGLGVFYNLGNYSENDVLSNVAYQITYTLRGF